MQDSFTVTNKVKGNPPIGGLPFADMKNAVLGPTYELSLVFVSEKEMHEINMKTRGKDKPTNILSFPLSPDSGEIIICPDYAKKEAPDFDRDYENYLGFLFIHGLVHLKGLDHGSIMEAEELKFRRRFNI